MLRVLNAIPQKKANVFPGSDLLKKLSRFPEVFLKNQQKIDCKMSKHQFFFFCCCSLGSLGSMRRKMTNTSPLVRITLLLYSAYTLNSIITD